MCRAPRQTAQQSPAICIYCGGTDHSSAQCHNRPWDNREQLHGTPESLKNQEFQCANSKISGNNKRNAGFHTPNTQRQPGQPIHKGPTVKFWEILDLTIQIIIQILTFPGETRPLQHDPRGNISAGSGRDSTRAGSGRDSTREGQHSQYTNQPNSNFRDYGYNQQRGAQSHTRFDERYNQKYSPPIYPPTPSLNSSFPEALSKSLLQIVENQSRTIEAMKTSQEAQAEAYKEMSRTNKMRDDDALFNSIEVLQWNKPCQV